MAKGWGWKLADLMLNLYSKGLLGGQPKEMMNLYEEALRGKVETGKAETTLGQKPIWTAGPDIPPGEGIAAGGIGATATGIMPPGREEGPTLAEAKALDLPGILKTMIGAKTTMPFQAPVARKLMGPTALEQMGTEFPYLSGEDIKFRNFLQWKLLKATQKLEQPTKIPAEGEEEVEEREGVSYAPGVKDLTTALLKTLDPGFMETAFGYREKEKVPSEYTLAPGQKRFVGKEEIAGVPPTPTEKKPRTGKLGELDEYRKTHPGATLMDLERAKKKISLMEAEPSIEDLSGEVLKWMKLEQSLEAGGIDNETLQLVMAFMPKDDPFKQAWQRQDFEALKPLATQNREYYQERLNEAQIKKAYPNARKDEQGNWTVKIGGKEYVITP